MLLIAISTVEQRRQILAFGSDWMTVIPETPPHESPKFEGNQEMLEELQSSADAKLLNVDTEKVEITADHLLHTSHH